MSSQPPAGVAAPRRAHAAYAPRHGDAQIELEKRLERLMRTNGISAASGLGDDTWNRVLTRQWHEPPAEARPDNLKAMRSTLKRMGDEKNR